jgi:hypothetical protein
MIKHIMLFVDVGLTAANLSTVWDLGNLLNLTNLLPKQSRYWRFDRFGRWGGGVSGCAVPQGVIDFLEIVDDTNIQI